MNKTEGLWNHKGPASNPKAVLISDELLNFLKVPSGSSVNGEQGLLCKVFLRVKWTSGYKAQDYVLYHG